MNLALRKIVCYGSYACLALVLSAGFGPAWSGVPNTVKRPNLLLVSIDTLRDDHCSSSGYERDTTPNLRFLAEQGVRFGSAYSASHQTAIVCDHFLPHMRLVASNTLGVSDNELLLQ